MSLDHLPADLEQNVQRIADVLHIPRDEALLKVIETGITFIDPTIAPINQDEGPIDEVATEAKEARRQRNAERRAKREALAHSRPETPDALIGYLANAPEVAENIRKLAYERRSQAFGNV